MKKILHIINGLELGGTETALFRLLRELHTQYQCYVIVLSSPGHYSDKIAGLSIPVYHLHMSSHPIKAFWRLRTYIKQIRPDIVQTWLYHADLIGGLYAKCFGIKQIIWSIRCEGVGLKTKTRWVQTICARLSHYIPHQIITNSEASLRYHVQIGYPKDKMHVIHNGFQADEWTPSHGPQKPSIVFGTLARYHDDKDYDTLIKAVDIVCKNHSNASFIFCGPGCHPHNEALTSCLQNMTYPEQVTLINGTHSAVEYLHSLDVFIQSSKTESFSNSLAEAMLCGLPCVATDVGETRNICGEDAVLVERQNPQELADACIRMLQKTAAERKQLGALARQRIQQSFSMTSHCNHMINLYEITNGREAQTCVD